MAGTFAAPFGYAWSQEQKIMRNFVLFVAAATLIGGSSLAIAQDRDNHGGPQGGGAHPAPQAAPHAGPAPHGGPAHDAHAPNNSHAPNNAPAMHAAPAPNAVRANNPAQAAPNAMRAAPNAMRGNNAPQANTNAMRANANRNNDPQGRGNTAPQGRSNNVQPNNNAQPNLARDGNANRGNAPHRDFSSVHNFHQNFNASHRFHAAPYRQPQGFYVHHWAWGETLPSAFWARDYWLNDFSDYDLPPPPPGTVWVRVGADALLVDADSGDIIEVDYGVFY
jgi:Ni/Co efflux regulator RcnB